MMGVLGSKGVPSVRESKEEWTIYSEINDNNNNINVNGRNRVNF